MAHFELATARVWLTGASSGIGAALARALIERGASVALFARREDKLRALADELGERALVQVGDVTDRARVQAAVAEAEQAFGGLDLVILNAGIGDSISLEDFDVELIERIHRVNFLGAVYGIEACLPGMRRSRSGTIVGITSPAAFRGLPTSSAYCASKAALATFLESLRHEAPDHGLSVLTVSPGFVESELTARNDHPMPGLMPADKAARIILSGIAKGRRHIHFPRRVIWPMLLLRMLPVPAYDFFVRKIILPRAKPKKRA